MDDFKDEMRHVQVHKFSADKREECRFDVGIVYGNLRDEAYMQMVEEHKAKKRRTEKEEPVKEEEKTPVKEEKPKAAPPPLRRLETVRA